MERHGHAGRDRANLGDWGELWLAAALPDGWIWQPPRRDVGKDGLVVIRDGSRLHNLEFAVQVKTSMKPRTRDGFLLVPSVPRAAVRYWFASPLPTLVVLVDRGARRGWYAWHLDLFDSPEELLASDAKTTTVRIPEGNGLDESGWVAIRSDLLNHFRSLQRALATDAAAAHVIPAINNLARIAGNLIQLAANRPPEGKPTHSEGAALLLEQIELKTMMATARLLIGRLPPDSAVHRQIVFWLKSFEADVLEAHPSVALLPEGDTVPLDFELVFAPKLVLAVRPRLVRSAVELIRLLTSPLPGEGHQAASGEE